MIKKNYFTLILTAAVVLVVFVGAYFFLSKGSTYAPTTENSAISEIKGDDDLSKANDSLDSSDLGSVDSSLSQLDSDTSGF